MLREALIFNVYDEAVVKEGLSFWTQNNYRNYLAGIATVPSFIGEYVPQQTHFDALFHILFVKRFVLTQYLENMQHLNGQWISNLLYFNRSYKVQPVNFNDEIDEGLNFLEGLYLKLDFSNIGNFPSNLTSPQFHHKILGLPSGDINVDLKKIFHPISDCTILENVIKSGFNWSSANPSGTYGSYGAAGSLSASVFHAAQRQSSTSYNVSLQHMYSIVNNDITKNYFKGVKASNPQHLSITMDTPFKISLTMPFTGYTVTLKSADGTVVNSNLLKHKPTCIGFGFLHRNDTTNIINNVSTDFFSVGELKNGRNAHVPIKVGTAQKVYIDTRTAVILGGDDSVSYAEIQEVKYEYLQSYIHKVKSGVENHTHTVEITTYKDDVIKGEVSFKNTPHRNVRYSNVGMYYQLYTYPNFNLYGFKNDRGTSNAPHNSNRITWYGEELSAEGRAASATERAEIKKSTWAIPNKNIPSERNTCFTKITIASPKMFNVNPRRFDKSSGSAQPQLSTSIQFSHIEVELTVYDPVTSIGKLLISTDS